MGTMPSYLFLGQKQSSLMFSYMVVRNKYLDFIFNTENNSKCPIITTVALWAFKDPWLVKKPRLETRRCVS